MKVINSEICKMGENIHVDVPYMDIDALIKSKYYPLLYNFNCEKCGKAKRNLMKCSKEYVSSDVNCHCDELSLARSLYNNILQEGVNNIEWSYDTINSFQTTFNRAVLLHIDNRFLNSLLKKGNKVSRDFLDNNEEVLLKNKEFNDLTNLEYIRQFKYLSHTLGNFTLIPFKYGDGARYTNRGRATKHQDYFDYSTNGVNSLIYKSFHYMKAQNCLKEFDDFEDYVNKLYLNDYVDFVDRIPMAKMFNEKYDSGYLLPQSREELKERVIEMLIRILKRGQEIISSMNDSWNISQVDFEKKVISNYIICKNIPLCSECINQCLINETFEYMKNIRG